MIDKRYHVFISTSGQDTKAERAVLSQALAGLGFFSWGLEHRTPQTTTFARRQIDDCDYFIVLLGGCYGEQLTSGISHFHLEYIYAITKKKPILVLIQESPELLPAERYEITAEAQQKFIDFRKQLQREHDTVVMFKAARDIEMVLRYAMPHFLERFPAIGWIRPTQASRLQQEIDRLNLQLDQLKKASAFSIDKALITAIPVTQDDDIFTFNYRVHIYQDNGFTELFPSRSLAWGDILAVLGPAFSPSAPEESFTRIMNAYLNEHALIDVSAEMPRAHAAARSQINVRALHAIKMQVKNNGWIVPVGRDPKDRILWELTSKGEKQLTKIHLDTLHCYSSVDSIDYEVVDSENVITESRKIENDIRTI